MCSLIFSSTASQNFMSLSAFLPANWNCKALSSSVGHSVVVGKLKRAVLIVQDGVGMELGMNGVFLKHRFFDCKIHGGCTPISLTLYL